MFAMSLSVDDGEIRSGQGIAYEENDRLLNVPYLVIYVFMHGEI